MKSGPAKLSVAALAVASAFLIAAAQINADLNGAWKMNPDQSRFFGPDDAPSSS